MEWITDYNLLASFISLTLLEIILGIDNLIFIALVVHHLPSKDQPRARLIGLTLALLIRVGLLFAIVWVMGLTKPWFTILDFDISGKNSLMFLGGLFLIYKATTSIHDDVTHDHKESVKEYKGRLFGTILQIILIDFIFSFDSVITAVGLTKNVTVIILAMTIAMLVMLFSAKHISGFIDKYPTLKILALAFIMMIGVFLVAEGLGMHIPKGYIYFAMLFSIAVEIINLKIRFKNSKN